MRVDRSEPSKNIIRGLRAWELLLERYPGVPGQVNFLQFLVPSRSELGVYQTYTDEIFELVESINDHYGDVDWQPIRVFYEENYPQAIAGMTLYDVLMVNPVIDGMNLVSKEGPLVNKGDGVLILSEMAGSFEQFQEHVLPVAPTDLEGTVRALHEALTMPEDERRRRAAALQAPGRGGRHHQLAGAPVQRPYALSGRERCKQLFRAATRRPRRRARSSRSASSPGASGLQTAMIAPGSRFAAAVDAAEHVDVRHVVAQADDAARAHPLAPVPRPPCPCRSRAAAAIRTPCVPPGRRKRRAAAEAMIAAGSPPRPVPRLGALR